MKVYDGGSSHLPIKVNPAGVIPAIFASSLLLLPTTIGTFSGGATNPVLSIISAYLGYGQPLHLVALMALIVFFSYLPEILIAKVGVPFYFGGTSVLIVVSVTMDTINQIQSHLLAHQYEALIEKSQLRGKRKSGTKAAAKPPSRR